MRKKLAAWAGLALTVVLATAALSPAFALGEAESGSAAVADAGALAATEPVPVGAEAAASAEGLAPSVAPIEAVALTVDAPVAGGTPGTTVTVPDGAEYTAEVQGWFDEGGQPFAGIFEVGKTYTVQLRATATGGQTFADNAAVTVNGNEPDAVERGVESLLCMTSFTVPEPPVPSVNVYLAGFNRPGVGDSFPTPKLDTSKEDQAGAGLSSVWYIGWYDKQGNHRRLLNEDETTLGYNWYDCDITITLKDGCTFDEGSRCFFGETDITASLTVSEDKKTLTYVYRVDYRGSIGGVNCTIVSLFGDDAPQTAKLRDFRDDALMQSAVGQALVGLYYDVSPAVVAFLDEHPMARSAARWLIDAFASMVPAREGGSL